MLLSCLISCCLYQAVIRDSFGDKILDSCGSLDDFRRLLSQDSVGNSKDFVMAIYSEEACRLPSGITPFTLDNLQYASPPGGVKPELWTRLKHLGINIRTNRGSRGGQHRSRPHIGKCNISSDVNNSNCQFNIPTVI